MGTFIDATAPAPTATADATPSAGGGTFLDRANNALLISGGNPGIAAGMLFSQTRTAGRLMDLLDRQRQATQAGLARGPAAGVQTLLHHADVDQQGQDRQALRQRLGIQDDYADPRLFGAINQPGWATHVERGLLDTVIDTLTDPVSYESLGVAPAARALGGVARVSGNAALGAARRIAPKLTDELVGYGNAVGDRFRPGGAFQRENPEAYRTALAADNRAAAKEQEAARRLQERYDAATTGLNDDEKVRVYRVLNGEEQLRDPASGRLLDPPHVVNAVADLRRLTKDMAALQATSAANQRLGYLDARLAPGNLTDHVEPWQLSYIKRKTPASNNRTRTNIDAVMAMQHPDDAIARRVPLKFTRVERPYRRPAPDVQGPFRFDPDLEDFASPFDQGVLGAGNLRSHYLPAPQAAAEVAEDAPEKTINPLRPFAPNLLQRDEFKIEGVEDVPKIEDAFRGAIRQAARQGVAGRLRNEVGVPLLWNDGSPAASAMEQFFERKIPARGSYASIGQRAAQRLQQLVDIPKNTVTTLGMKHGAVNVPTLAYNAEGAGAAAEALARGVQLARMGERERYEALRPAIEGGVISPFIERENPIADTLQRSPLIGSTIGRLSAGANNLTWAIDDAAKAAVFRRKIARGMKPNDAAAETLRDMVDYRHRSDFVKALSRVAPFATFRAGMPGAIASGLARDPRRALVASRATNGIATSGQIPTDAVDENGNPMPRTFNTPYSDTFEVAQPSGPQRYARATLGDPARVSLSPFALPYTDRNGKRHIGERYFTYGMPLLPHQKDGRWRSGFLLNQLAGYVPGGVGELGLQAAGLNEYPARDWLSVLLGNTLGAY